jgi:amino-acid N-acetyltransferase
MLYSSFVLPTGCTIRPAQSNDVWVIRKLVLSARLDPTQLRWQQFWIIEADDRVVACGQLRQFSNAQELGSLVVSPQWRGQGLGSYLTQHLIQQATQPLYLECLGDRLAQFYTRFGFVAVDWNTSPDLIKQKFRLSRWVSTLLRLRLFIMQYQANV